MARRIGHRATSRCTEGEEITELLREGPVAFVIAEPGRALQWIAASICFDFWKTEVKPRLALAGSRIELDQFSGAYCYLASDWGLDDARIPIVLLERYH